jgi:hypothetical protein
MIYFAEAIGVGHIKIGFTDGDAAVRLDTLQTGSPVPLRLLGTRPGTLDDEKDLHRRFAGALVHGEWFRPVAELLDLIGNAEAKACGNMEVVTKSVQIKVLTVGRRQFTKSLLEQLPTRDPVAWESIFPAVEDAVTDPDRLRSVVSHLDLQFFIDGSVWGTVTGGYGTDHDDRCFETSARRLWVVWEEAGVLYKHAYYPHMRNDDMPSPGKLSNKDLREYHWALRQINRRLTELPGWSEQLYIGV